jgi:hypothetical protein
VCGGTAVDFQEDPFPGNGEMEKKVKCCSGKVMIITD